MKKIFLISLMFLFGIAVYSQAKDDPIDYENALLIEPIISFQFPGADFAKRFGLSYQFGLGLEYKFSQNWYIGGEGSFMFGTKVKEDDHIFNTLTASQLVITNEGFLDEVNVSLRGATVKVNAGKSFFFKPAKPSNGVLIKVGIGYLQHKILIDVDKDITPQLTGDYAKGYDRFSNGLLLSQYIGLVRLEKNKFVNLSFGFELTEAFTSNARPYDFYLNQKLTDKRVDLMYGLKLIWMIPVYTGTTTASQYYTY